MCMYMLEEYQALTLEETNAQLISVSCRETIGFHTHELNTQISPTYPIF